MDYLDYSLTILRAERDKLQEEFLNAQKGDEKEWNWDVICKNERLLEDLNKAIDIIWESQFN